MADGETLWERELGIRYWHPHAIEGRLYVLEAGIAVAARFHCLDLLTGEGVYSLEQPAVRPLDRPFGGTHWRTQIAFGTDHGLVLGIATDTGEAVWWSRYGHGLRPPVFLGERAFVPAFDGRLLVFVPPG